MPTATLTTKGQVTIPKEVREHLGVDTGDRLSFVVQDDGSVVVVFAETELKNAHAIARRLLSVMRHTSHGKRDRRAEPDVSVTTLLPKDTAKSLLARLYHDAHRAAS